MHPIAQILEKLFINQSVSKFSGINENIRFVLRMGYVKNYSALLTPIRPVVWFVRT